MNRRRRRRRVIRPAAAVRKLNTIFELFAFHIHWWLLLITLFLCYNLHDSTGSLINLFVVDRKNVTIIENRDRLIERP